MKAASFVLAAAMALTLPAQADPFVDALEAAIEAYRDGDLQYAEDELVAAQRVLSDRKAAGLADFLPDAPDGWTRLIDDGAGQMLGFLGGGTMASATYSSATDSFDLSFMADNPMVAQLAMMMGNAAMITQMGGQVERINRVRFIRDDDSLKAIVGNRILVQAEGADPDVMIPFLEKIDFQAMERFGL